jgi:hypothetical protein
MGALRNKTNAGNFQKTLAFLAVAMFSYFAIGIAVPAKAAVVYGIDYDIYTSYYSSTGVRPMDDPSVVSNYTFCKSGTFSTVDTNWGGGNIEGCGGDYILIHYKGYLYSETAQTLYFRGYSDDGFHAKVGDTVVVNNWRLQGCGVSGTGQGVTFNAGEYKPIDIWFFEHGGGACSMFYYSTSVNGAYSSVPSSMYTTTNYQAANFTDTTITNQIAEGELYSSSVEASASGTVSYSLFDGELPPGIAINSSTGALSGSPNTSGTYTFRIRAQATDDGQTTNDYTEELTVTVGSVVSGGAGLEDKTLWIGDMVSERAIFTGFPAPTVTKVSGDLPPGISVSSNGTVSGSPTAAGIYTFSVRGYNFVNSISTTSYTYTVQAAPAFTDDEDYTTTTLFGAQVNLTPTVLGPSVTFSLASGDLPGGLSLNSSTGAVSGKTTESGVFTYRIRASNNSGNDLSATSTITVRRAPNFTSSSVSERLNKGTSYTYDFEAAGYPTPTYSVISGNLPSGMTLNAQSGRLTGIPTIGGVFNFTIRATNSIDDADVAKSITVNAAPRAIETGILQEILAGTAYADGITYESHPAPLYSVSQGALPIGLLLGLNDGSITGIPTIGGLYNFKIKVVSGDSEATTDNYAVTVNQVPTKFDESVIEKTELGKTYADAVIATGYPLPVYRISSGSLPNGLKLNASTGAITGTTSVTGFFDFTVEASNSVGTLLHPLKIAVQAAPIFTSGDFPSSINVGDTVAAKFVATGFPAPTYRVTSGSLPDGLSLDENNGTVTGITANGGKYTFVIGATNELATTNFNPVTVAVIGVKTEIGVSAKIGDEITGKTVAIASQGLKPLIEYEVILRSTPQTIASGKTSTIGAVEEQTKIPGGLEPGWHSITLTSTNPDGTPFEKAVYFQVTETLLLEEISEVPPTDAQRADALVNDPEFYARMGLDPAATVTAEAVAEQVEQVTSVVASVALVSAAAAGAAAAASAAGGASSSNAGGGGGARTGGPSSSSSSSSSGGGARAGGGPSASSSSSSGGGTASSSGSGDSENDSADYGNLEADHDDFETDGAGAVDKLSIWRSSTLTILDKPLTNWIERVAQVSPVLSRVLNDGSYLRSLVGSVMGLAYLAAVVVGIAAVDTGASSLATSGKIGLLVLIMAFGTLDALFGIVAMSAFVITSLVAMPVAGVGDIRYLVAMFILGFAPSIMATTFRKIRRPAIEGMSDAWERVIDLALIGFISVLTVMSLVGSVSAFAGATVPISGDTRPIAFAIAAVAVGRVVLEEFAAKFAPNRLNRLNPTEVLPTFGWQPWASLVLKFATLIVMIGGMVGMGWHLWVGAFLIFLPGIIGMVFPKLPSVKWIHEFIPGGIGALAFATLISAWSGQFVNSWLGKSELYGQLSFILIPLPVILIAIIGMFAKQEEKLWQRTGKKWVGIAGGIAVFVFTIQVTNFIPTIFG